MGYRRLLKDYLRHVDFLVGSNLAQTAKTTGFFSARDIGELRTLAAEVSRERNGGLPNSSYLEVLDGLADMYGLTPHGISQRVDLPPAALARWQSQTPLERDEFLQLLLPMLQSEMLQRR